MDSLTLVIFGITGNLSQVKLLPALYDMAEKGLLPKKFQILGNARKPKSKTELEDYIHQALIQINRHHKHQIKEDVFRELIKRIDYLDGHLDDPDFYQRLAKLLKQKNAKNIIFYLATYPDLYHLIFENLKKANLDKRNIGFTRLIIEKPVGHDLASGKKLNRLLKEFFSEDQIFRLDHYLGKETLQNILSFRFGNDIFEPLINSAYIDHIQITAAEDFGVGLRGGYYDKVGALKDVGQNHQLQMIAFATMEAPKEFSNQAVTKERLKILQALTPLPKKVVFGQYRGYNKEENIDPNSQTDTFYAFKTFVNTPKLKGVPIYARAGKKLAQTVTEIVFVFKNKSLKIFKGIAGDQPNMLIYRIQPNEGIVLKIMTKKPGHKVELKEEFMQFCYRQDPDGHYFPDPYEKLLIDTIAGDQTFFNDAEEVEAQWAFIDPLVAQRKKVEVYKVGSWGPKAADKLIGADGRKWLKPSMEFCRI